MQGLWTLVPKPEEVWQFTDVWHPIPTPDALPIANSQLPPCGGSRGRDRQ